MKYKVGDKIKRKLYAPTMTNLPIVKLYNSNGGWLQIRLVSEYGYRYVGDEGLPRVLRENETYKTNDELWILAEITKPKPFKLR